jgi:hypothetical protein
MQPNPKPHATTCALVNYFNDEDMLRMQYESGQFDHYERIYVFDGPYAFNNDFGPFAGASPRLTDSEFGSRFASDRRVEYHWDIYPDEATKRMHAYSTCAADIVVIHDTDEFYSIDEGALEEFRRSPCGVAYFWCQNLCLDGLSNEEREFRRTDDLPWKAFMFKKDRVGAKEHLDYLWLVGVRQSPPDPAMRFAPPVALGYHFTQMRTTRGQAQKFSFYVSLYHHRHGDDGIHKVMDTILRLVDSGKLTAPQAREVFLGGISDFTGAPAVDSGKVLRPRLRAHAALETILDTANARRHRFAPGPRALVRGWPLFLYIEKADFASVSLSQTRSPTTARLYGYRMGAAERELIGQAELSAGPQAWELPAGLHGAMLIVESAASGEALQRISVDASAHAAVA